MKTYKMNEIMKSAWTMVKTYGFTMSEALKNAWKNAKLDVAMHKGIAKFTFRKVDGTIREAWGTLVSTLIPTTSSESGRKPNPSVHTYYDTEKQAWRCFKRVNLM